LHHKTETLNSLTLKIETHNVVKCLGDNYSEQIWETLQEQPPKINL